MPLSKVTKVASLIFGMAFLLLIFSASIYFFKTYQDVNVKCKQFIPIEVIIDKQGQPLKTWTPVVISTKNPEATYINTVVTFLYYWDKK